MKVAVIGASGGIGGALARQLAGQDHVREVFATYRRQRPAITGEKYRWQQLDVTQESSIRSWARCVDEVDWLVIATGMLHAPDKRPEKSINELNVGFFLENMWTNALSALLIAKHVQAAFRHGRPSVFSAISARVGSIGDNRLGGWYSYRASKASLNMGMKTLSIEWRRTLPNVTVAVLHPGTTDTGLSAPFLNNVPAGKLFDPERSAAQLQAVLSRLTPEESGRFWAYDGSPIPW